MAIEVFNRYEYKYVITEDIFNILIEKLNEKLNFDKFCQRNEKYTIINHYVDTKDYQMIRDSLDKPIYKQKLRLRMYNQLESDEDLIFFEIKKKYKGLVNKRRCCLKYKEAMEMIYENKFPNIQSYMNKQILKEIFYILQMGEYQLTSKIMYERIALFSDDYKLRVSFDFNINSQNIEHLDSKRILMEIKTPDSIPIWLIKILNELSIKSQSFSKYGKEFNAKLEREKYDKHIDI